jgi:hypothetical protein
MDRRSNSASSTYISQPKPYPWDAQSSPKIARYRIVWYYILVSHPASRSSTHCVCSWLHEYKSTGAQIQTSSKCIWTHFSTPFQQRSHRDRFSDTLAYVCLFTVLKLISLKNAHISTEKESDLLLRLQPATQQRLISALQWSQLLR